MNSYGPHGANRRTADALLTSLVEEAIVETLDRSPERPPEPERADPTGPAGFLQDVAVFLRARPDAAELLRQLHTMVLPPDPPAEAAPDRPAETSELPQPEHDDGPRDEPDA
jgi:hypothetical protein